jgi:hypothetical protein
MSWTTITILALGLTPFSPAIKDGNPSALFIQFPADGTHATKTLAFGDATTDPQGGIETWSFYTLLQVVSV